MSSARCTIHVGGLVQGVGFRPFAHALATRFALGGLVYNGVGGVHIEVEGDSDAIRGFLHEVTTSPPPSASISSVTCRSEAPRREQAFVIVESPSGGPGAVIVPADVATCDACLAELFDPDDRRFQHPLITCAHCGPRATIVARMPYDRERTTMAELPPCSACRGEYADPGDRRFHAQAIACPDCGPRLRLLDGQARDMTPADPIDAVARALVSGSVVGLKGLGGFHLLCDATNENAVTRLRRQKQRDGKPFAVMVATVREAQRIGRFDERALGALQSPASPIVLVPRRENSGLAASVAPAISTIGLMLPYTPVHHLLLRTVGERSLVVTSGNASDEPIACTDGEALRAFGDVVAGVLTHDRRIDFRCEDSVVRSNRAGIVPVRRSRGHAPLPVDVDFRTNVPTLAVGGADKAVFAVATGGHVVLSPHLGNLEGYAAYRAYGDAVARFERLLGIEPTRVVRDLHPDYASTRFAEESRLAEVVAVQHHHAHMASCMAENRLTGDVIGVCFDGSGLGTDGTSWGGEFLVGSYAGFLRAAHLSPVGLPGGDRAAREPWRAALAHVHAAGVDLERTRLACSADARTVASVWRLVDSAPRTTSMGRLFDAVAGITGVLDVATYEGEAALRLESLAEGVDGAEGYPVTLHGDAPTVVNVGPLIAAVTEDVARGREISVIARRFHTTIVDLVERVCIRLRDQHRHDRVVLSGGVFVNAILGSEIPERLVARGFSVFQHRIVPPNDGGLCLGQLAIAAHGGGIGRRQANSKGNG